MVGFFDNATADAGSVGTWSMGLLVGCSPRCATTMHMQLGVYRGISSCRATQTYPFQVAREK